MERKAKVELFEQIRREYEFGHGTIKGIAKKFGIHRRMVRQALQNAIPLERRRPDRDQPKLKLVKGYIDTILEHDRKMPRKQRHTAERISWRLAQELGIEIGKSTVRCYVRQRKIELGLKGRETCVPQSYDWGVEAQVDWYEAYVEFGGESKKVEVCSMRSMASGGAFHRAYPRATQQAFFEAQELAFHYFGGVFKVLRFDNLKSAVKKVLRGHTREENSRFIAFRSHWQFEAEFCRPGKQGAHEKGGVEEEAGYFRRNHLVPIPMAKDLADLNQQLLAACIEDQQRVIGERNQSVGVGMLIEQAHLLPKAPEGFDLAEACFPTVDGHGRVKVRNNWYSVPAQPGTKVRIRVLPLRIEAWSDGQVISSHERCYGRNQQILNLEHYLDVLEHKPGALAGSKPLEQWRRMGRWPQSFDTYWRLLQQRSGRQAGTKEMIELLQLGLKHGWPQLRAAIEKALELGCSDPAAVRHLMMVEGLTHQPAETLAIGVLACYERPLPELTSYDQLLEVTQ